MKFIVFKYIVMHISVLNVKLSCSIWVSGAIEDFVLFFSTLLLHK